MNERLRQQYLTAMGIQAWELRSDGGAQQVQQPAATKEPGPPVGARLPAESPQDGEPPEWLDEVPPPTEEWASLAMPEQEPARPDAVATLDWAALAQRVVQCNACELHASRRNTVFGVGNKSADLLVVGEAPGAEEDRQGEPFVGPAGQLLNAMLRAIGLQREQVYIANVLKCRPPGNREPRLEEALKCEPFLRRQIALVAPRVILAVGGVAARHLLKTEEPVGRLRGKRFHIDDIPVVVSYHPAYLLRSSEQKAKSWEDLQRVVALLR